MNFRRSWYFLPLAILFSCSEKVEVDLVLHNAHVYTGETENPNAEAIAVKDGKILEVGAEHQIMNRYVATNTVDLQKQFIYPGFIDAHSHFLGYGRVLSQVDLVGTNSFQDVVDKCLAFQQESTSDWLIGRGWDQNDWENTQLPTNEVFDELFPGKFVVLKRIDGHAMLVSNNVLELAGVSGDTKVDGGEVVTKNGVPTGVLVDEATRLVESVIPALTKEEDKAALLEAQKKCFEAGLTTVTDAGLEVDEINLINEMQEQGDLKMRVYAMYSASHDLLNDMSSKAIVTDRLRAQSIKVYADGALGSQGAYLSQPYAIDSTKSGLCITPKDSIERWANACFDAGFQLNVHCIGDLANTITLDAMGAVLGGTNDRRWRIEHAQVVKPEDRNKFGGYNVIPSMQPTHATSDMYWIEEIIGPHRAEWAYSMKSLCQENGMIALGTDFPVEAVSPLMTFYASVFRVDRKGFPEGGFLMDEGLNRAQTLNGMTIWAAMASFEEETRGSIEKGKFADFTVLDVDLLNCGPEEVLDASVIQTWVNGELVYEK